MSRAGTQVGVKGAALAGRWYRRDTHTTSCPFFDVSGHFGSVFLAPMGAFGGQGHLGMVEALFRLVT